MTKCNPNMAPSLNQTGQISIFFSASLVVMISIIAFVINIGLFVKAKINLQNATDAAAYAGASVQARQLSKIAYLNWDMRNIFKEWMYKYYVVGNLNIKDVATPPSSLTMDYLLDPSIDVLREATDPLRVTKDLFNIPAICIHIEGSQTNICKRYSVPGLPEFGSSNLPGAEEASRVFMDELISAKVNDCVDRTRLNMMVANTWTYNVLSNSMDESLASQGPAILSNRQGAWPRAVELALRIRNLEFIMNRKAETTPICASGSTGSGLTNCSKSITSIEQEQKLGNERLIKAFYSGYRNLGNELDNEMKESFTLTELPPRVVRHDSQNNASNLLIDDPQHWDKQWIDLKLMMVNYAIFYTAMIPRADTATSGACDVSKVAIPVPGYPMGFHKDPNLITYYAVRGEAEFVGMFNPFNQDAIKLRAYSAAKPFGGRIGPALFIQKPNQDAIHTRNDAAKYRSVPYITTHDFDNVTIRGQNHRTTPIAGSRSFIPGLPLPTNANSFWLEEPDQPIGGRLADANGIRFGVPNLVYDYQVPFETTGYTDASQSLNKIKASTETVLPIGLYSVNQFSNFKGPPLENTIGPDALMEKIGRVRAPTLYDAANYLIPTPYEFNITAGLDSFGFIAGEKLPLKNGYDRYRANIYAPLYKEGSNDQTDLLYDNSAQVTTAIKKFMEAQKTGMDKYRMAMNRAAKNIYDQKDSTHQGATGSAPGYIRAANGVSDVNFAGDENTFNPDQIPKSCESLAGQFLYFYYGGGVTTASPVQEVSPACPKPLGDMVEEYFSQASKDNFSATYYTYDLYWKQGNPEDGLKFLTAYMPGPFTGVGDDARYQSPIDSNISDNMRRNTYSTKFITLDSLRQGREAQWDNPGFAIYAEGDVTTSAEPSLESAQKSFANPLEPSLVGADDLSTIKY